MRYEFKYVYGHVEVYLNGKFCGHHGRSAKGA